MMLTTNHVRKNFVYKVNILEKNCLALPEKDFDGLNPT